MDYVSHIFNPLALKPKILTVEIENVKKDS